MFLLIDNVWRRFFVILPMFFCFPVGREKAGMKGVMDLPLRLRGDTGFFAFFSHGLWEVEMMT